MCGSEIMLSALALSAVRWYGLVLFVFVTLSFSFSDTFEMVSEDEDGKVMFKVNYHYMSQVKNASDTNSAARSRRLAQEAVTLSTSLPLSSSSSVFVRCDEERLDIMKVTSYQLLVPSSQYQPFHWMSVCTLVSGYRRNVRVLFGLHWVTSWD